MRTQKCTADAYTRPTCEHPASVSCKAVLIVREWKQWRHVDRSELWEVGDRHFLIVYRVGIRTTLERRVFVNTGKTEDKLALYAEN